MLGQALELLVGEDAEGDPHALGASGCGAQHEAVMAGLLHPTQVDRALVALGDREADHLDVEAQAALQIGDENSTWLARVMLNGSS